MCKKFRNFNPLHLKEKKILLKIKFYQRSRVHLLFFPLALYIQLQFRDARKQVAVRAMGNEKSKHQFSCVCDDSLYVTTKRGKDDIFFDKLQKKCSGMEKSSHAGLLCCDRNST